MKQAHTVVQCPAVDIYCYRDGTMAATSKDITGLVLEASSFRELRAELIRVARRLLRSNHGLAGEELANAELHARLHGEPNETNPSIAPVFGLRLSMQDHSLFAASQVRWLANGRLSGS